MKNQLLINELNQKENQDFVNRIGELIDTKEVFELTKKRIIMLEEEVAEYMKRKNVSIVGSIQLNKRITLIPAKSQEVVDFEASLDANNVTEKDFVLEKITKEFDKNKFLEKFKDNLVYKTKKTKLSFKITPLFKENNEDRTI